MEKMNTMNQIIEELLHTRGQWLQRKKEGVEFSKLKEQVERVMRVRTLRGYGDTEFENGINAMLANGQILVKTDSSRTVHYRLINDPIYQQHMEGTVRQFSTPFRNEDVSVVSGTMSQLSLRDSVPSSISASYPNGKRQRLLAEEQVELRMVEEIILAERLSAEQQQEEQDRLVAERILAVEQQEAEEQRLLAAQQEAQERQRILLAAQQEAQERQHILLEEQQEAQERQRLLEEEQAQHERQRLLEEEQAQHERQRLLEEERQRLLEVTTVTTEVDDNDDDDVVEDVVKLPGMNSREKADKKVERIKRIDNHVTNPPSSEQDQIFASFGFSTSQIRYITKIMNSDKIEFHALKTCFQIIVSHKNTNPNHKKTEQEKQDAFSDEKRARKILYDWLMKRTNKEYVINLGSPPSFETLGVVVLNYAPWSCKDYNDPSKEETNYNKIDPNNACINVLLKILPKSILKENGADINSIDPVLEAISPAMSFVDRIPFVVRDKNQADNELKEFAAVLGLPMHMMSLIPATLVALKAMRFNGGNNDCLYRLVSGAPARDVVRGTPALTTLSVMVGDCGGVTHMECCLNRKYLRNPSLFPPLVLQEMCTNILYFYMKLQPFRKLWCTLLNQETNPTSTETTVFTRWGNNNCMPEEIEELLAKLSYYSSGNETPWQLEMQGYRCFGSGRENQHQLDTRAAHGFGGEAENLLQLEAGFQTQHAPHVSGQHASTVRENVATAVGGTVNASSKCCMCLHDLKYNPEVIEFCHSITIPPEVVQKDQFIFVQEIDFGSGKKRLINHTTGGCVECNVYVCKDHWPSFDCNTVYETDVTFMLVCQSLFYLGFCPSCNDYCYYVKNKKNEIPKRCIYSKNHPEGTTQMPTYRSIPSDNGEKRGDPKKKRCWCRFSCECTSTSTTNAAAATTATIATTIATIATTTAAAATTTTTTDTTAAVAAAAARITARSTRATSNTTTTTTTPSNTAPMSDGSEYEYQSDSDSD